MPRLQESAFDAIPSAVFIVNDDLSICDFNDASGSLPDDVLLSTLRPGVEEGRIGDLIQCVEAQHSGCGNSMGCKNCGIMNALAAVKKTSENGGICRTLISIRLQREDAITSADFLTTARLFRHNDHSLVLLMMENAAHWSSYFPTGFKVKSTVA